MSSRSASLQEHGSAAFALCEAAALAARAQTLLADVQARLDAFGDGHDPSHPAPDRPTRRLGAQELERLRAGSEELAELTAQIALAVDGLPLAPLVVGERELASAARAALAEGIVDQRRAHAAASLLSADEGLPALADALVGSDAHAYWTAPVVDLLAAFRGLDRGRARRLAARAGVPEGAAFSELAPERVLALARALRGQAAAA